MIWTQAFFLYRPAKGKYRISGPFHRPAPSVPEPFPDIRVDRHGGGGFRTRLRPYPRAGAKSVPNGSASVAAERSQGKAPYLLFDNTLEQWHEQAPKKGSSRARHICALSLPSLSLLGHHLITKDTVTASPGIHPDTLGQIVPFHCHHAVGIATALFGVVHFLPPGSP